MQERSSFDERGNRDEGATERAREMAGEARETVSQAAREAGAATRERAERGREQTADSLSDAARELRGRGGDGPAGQVTDRLAGGMERTAGYLRHHDTSEIRDDLEMYVREHPVQSLGAAVVAGFFIGRMLR